MKKYSFLKIMVIVLLVVSVSLPSKIFSQTLTSLNEGTYTVGSDLPSGLSRFSIIEGSASVSITRGSNQVFYETISDGYYDTQQFTAALKDGDQVDVYVYYGTSSIQLQQLAKLDLNKLSAGYYEVGSDIPSGTYTIHIGSLENEYDSADVVILNAEGNQKDSFYLYSEAPPYRFSLSNGEKLQISGLSDTLTLKEIILVPQSITLSKSSLSLMVKRTAQVTAVVNPSTATNRSVGWTSSNPEIATVDSNGIVVAIKTGTTTITATANGNPSIKKSIPVTVTKVIPISLTVSKTVLNIANNQSVKVNASVSPADAENKTILWKSSNTKVVTVDSMGNIKGHANGTTTVTATAKDNPLVIKSITVKVSPKTVKTNKSSVTVATGKTTTLSAVVSPSDSVDKTVRWTSSNTKIATVNSKGTVAGKSKGIAYITASVKGAQAVKIKVTVTPPVLAKSVKLNRTSATVYKGKTLTLTATVNPSNTTIKTVKWTSSNTKVAKVDSKGKVTAVGVGTAKITAATTNGKTASATITVPYLKSLSAGKWKAGTDLPAGRYRITTNSGSGNVVIGLGTDHRFVNEVLSSVDDGFGVTVITTDINSGDNIEIMGLNSVQFTRISHVKSNTLTAGNFMVGKDIAAGTYKMTTPSGSGNLIIFRGNTLLVNEILARQSDGYSVTSVTRTLRSGDHISIYGLNKVLFTKK